ncbi:probable G-protein coupled receptor CG31760 [Adelges cooleyi]|uniref:probable G-protein coupled receptor CG31760 n=1 Tax=Adelges cooleyi TaxID=133065 RepID=UPI00217FFBF8|nr:probable G-protein coupled receptor CG31760 [Adelges cooleyi]
MLVATVVSMWVLSAMAVTVRHGRSRMARWAQQQHNDQPVTRLTTVALDDGIGLGSPSLMKASGGGPNLLDKANALLRVVESQQHLGGNCTAGTDLNMGEGVVDRYAQERFRVMANVAVNRANMLTRIWKYANPGVTASEYLLHASVISMVEFDDDIFAAGNCYDQNQYKDYWLFCPYAYRLPDGKGILAKDLAVEYKYLSNTSEWFYIARQKAQGVIKRNNQYSHAFNSYTWNDTAHTKREADDVLTVTYEDGKWSKPYYDCGGGNIWMLTYTVPFFGYRDGKYFFKGTSGIDIDLRRVDIDQCPLPLGSNHFNIFASSDKCKKQTTYCVAVSGLGFRRGSYKCVCRRGYYFPAPKYAGSAGNRFFNGVIIEEEYEKLMLGQPNNYSQGNMFECMRCAEGCDDCVDASPCIASLNWVLRSIILALSLIVICCLPLVVFFTWKYGDLKVVRAASPALLRVIALGAFFIYATMIVMYPKPNVITCIARFWLREIGFSLTYGALMLKTWRISVIFRVKSAKVVKITDKDLLKRLGLMMVVVGLIMLIRTLVDPPYVIVGRTSDNLKTDLCPAGWWDRFFSILEVLFLVWGIRLCIVVRRAPSEFNESRFMSMAIYNEFILSVFLNVSMFFLQSPANPDLQYIIFFCHTQLTVTTLLGFIFASKAYLVIRGEEFNDEDGQLKGVKVTGCNRILSKQTKNSNKANNSTYGCVEESSTDFILTENDVQDEFAQIFKQLEALKDKNIRMGNQHLVNKIVAMQEVSRHSVWSTNVEKKAEHCTFTGNHISNHPLNVSSQRSLQVINQNGKKPFMKEVTV